jgi:hypothetical protein
LIKLGFLPDQQGREVETGFSTAETGPSETRVIDDSDADISDEGRPSEVQDSDGTEAEEAGPSDVDISDEGSDGTEAEEAGPFDVETSGDGGRYQMFIPFLLNPPPDTLEPKVQLEPDVPQFVLDL